jgi:uncharacterized protein with PhoU and TrkA domain
VAVEAVVAEDLEAAEVADSVDSAAEVSGVVELAEVGKNIADFGLQIGDTVIFDYCFFIIEF